MRTTWRPRRASWTPTWCMCTTCCRCPVHAGSRRRARPGRPCSCTSTTCGSSAPSAWRHGTALPAFAATIATRCPGSPSTAAARCPRPLSTPWRWPATSRRLRGRRPLRGPERLRRGPVRAAGRAGGPDRRAAALPARRGVRGAQPGGSGELRARGLPGSRPRRASTPPSRPLRPPAFPCGWRGRDRPRRISPPSPSAAERRWSSSAGSSAQASRASSPVRRCS